MTDELSPLFLINKNENKKKTVNKEDIENGQNQISKAIFQQKRKVLFGQKIEEEKRKEEQRTKFQSNNFARKLCDDEFISHDLKVSTFKRSQSTQSTPQKRVYSSRSPCLVDSVYFQQQSINLKMKQLKQKEQSKQIYLNRDANIGTTGIKQPIKRTPVDIQSTQFEDTIESIGLEDLEWEEQHTLTEESSPMKRRRSPIVPMFKSQMKITKLPFTKFTPKTTEFQPIAPMSWILEGKEPTREEISSNIELYSDMTTFISNKDLWRKNNLLDHLSYYADSERISVLACTWNVNQCVFSRGEIDRLTSGIKNKPDIIVIGLEELEMSFDAIITGKKFSDKSIQWEALIQESINRGQNTYIELGYYQLCGVVLYVFFDERLKNHITDVGYGDIRVGAMSGKLANKGGVAYRMRIYNSTICFVVSHLAAHQNFCDKRNEDWNEISKMKIRYFDVGSGCRKVVELLQHDVVIWMGDLNYRIDMDDVEVRKCMKMKNYLELIKHDQLLYCMQSNKVFNHFCEAAIKFAPTFKIKIGKQGMYEENRIPSWCDRVLWKTENRHNVEVKEYMSHELYCSDHKPVTCFMSIDLQRINIKLQQTVINYLDKVEKIYSKVVCPKIIIEPSIITIDQIKLFEKYQFKVQLKNIGKFGTCYEIENGDGRIFKDEWLSIKKCEGFIDILEGKDVVSIDCEICIDEKYVWMYQEQNSLMKVIKIKLGEGNEFITFSIVLKTTPNIIGMNLETLNRLNKPLISNDKIQKKYQPIPFFIPKEIYRLIDYIIQHYEPNCFVKKDPCNYLKEQLIEVIQCLNKEKEFISGPIQLYCDALLLVLSGLHKCVIFYSFTDSDLVLNDQTLLQVVNFIIPDEYNHLFVYLITFLKKLICLGENELLLISRFTPPIFRCFDPNKLLPFTHFLEYVLHSPLSLFYQ
ncbi:inositol polyphosphate-5-phosphatase, putative [Entamoeba histolytica HM-1:IMSS-B]|uniref:Inositol polyphosphate-5-phosphatase, putative n=6 Tax=Entamoeba histolytica TaxID=5759 RepID=C4M795_ENTH1|nr:inositol polyphosphate-5-phosphatase, putative [Entamoeba histolytica HM-1:IMSS]EMD46588.1 type II inositol1,4,5-trisphosphate 5-phosphatase precursor, putative [Entamoeba histolytica KU27]EMH72555.1 inositol polyphosphate-5-phosphatase, putative [Entamoeba histolytica HM-1:IMSS-B]EMS15038.1 type II inositol-1,4,5-trisphosphate 5-phosphatase precursor, putative [Entamoeba histolytica HM-3:IMSS]ENY60397.1 type II inositol-1,4,5-trisphosphate 5-phosphatase precursor, putative [Entamoeba histol|eukprot:XP_650540.1 inositol polyphosphate-5-phosphatase, putative [Entamoeba histolytica HM-1:IMSS]